MGQLPYLTHLIQVILITTVAKGSYAMAVDARSLMFAPFEEQFTTLLDREEYDGAALGVIQNGQLIYAKGFGSGIDDRPVDASTSLPASSLSKTLTALGVLKLVEDGQLDLSERVFGDNGIMRRFELKIIDSRMFNVTVGDLLHHSGGWDEHKGPVYDPMLNKVYIARGYNIEDIEDTIDAKSELTSMDIIDYMVGKPLAFQPGTAVRYSNFGYCLLGRIIEEITGEDYDQFILHHILRPAGMMHTRIGFKLALPNFAEDLKDATLDVDSQLIHSLIDPQVLDSTLGWYSSVQDIARLTISLMSPGINQLLKPETLELMFRRPLVTRSTAHSWYGIGLHVRNDGAFWQESDKYDNDGILYHVGIRGFLGQGISKKADESLLSDDITIVVLTTNNRFRKLKSAMERLVPYVKVWPRASLSDKSIDDLADIQVKTEDDDVLMKHRLPEQHLQAYVNAIRLSRYIPVWLHGYRNEDTTHFAVISKKVHDDEALHFRLEVSKHPKHLRERIHHWEVVGDYKVNFLQSYISASHGDELTHMVILSRSNQRNRKWPLSPRWGINMKLKDYLPMLVKRTKKGFTVKAQSVSMVKQEAMVDYMLIRIPASDSHYYSAYHDLTLQQLELVAKSNAAKEFSLQYLDTHHNNDEEPHFSAVFTKSKNSKWIFQVGVKLENVNNEARNWQARGYIPKILVGYTKNNELNFAALWVM